MNDLDVLTDRLHELGQRAPVPTGDPLLDIRRGRAALRRRRRARAAAGVGTTLVVVGAVAITTPAFRHSDAGETSLGTAATATGTPSPTAQDRKESCRGDDAAVARRGPTTTSGEKVETGPAGRPTLPGADAVVGPALSSYRAAAAAILDPSGSHLDLGREIDNVQSGCDPSTGRLTSLGTKLAWTSGDALGMVQLEVVSREHSEKPQIVISHDRWTISREQLPAGVTEARIADYQGGHAVVVEREDGLSVAVDAAEVWGNNAAPGSRPVKDLPGIGELLALAASPLLTLPEG